MDPRSLVVSPPGIVNDKFEFGQRRDAPVLRGKLRTSLPHRARRDKVNVYRPPGSGAHETRCFRAGRRESACALFQAPSQNMR